jgi:transcriptional regulator with XRE-family HTH domain
MGAIGDIIRQLREDRGWDQGELLDRFQRVAKQRGLIVSMSKNVISRRETGKIAIKPPERKLWAEVFGMSVEEFDQQWRGSRVHDRPAPMGIPVINRGPAGVVQPYDHDHMAGGEFHNAFEYVDRGDPQDEARYISDDLAFALIIVGDSMEPAMTEGDLAVFTPMTVPRPRQRLENGKVVFVRFGPESKNEGVTVARWFQQADGSIQLSKDNRKYPALSVKAEEIVQLACCVELRKRRI